MKPASTQEHDTYLRSQVQDQMFDHVTERFGESQQLAQEVITSSEADNVHHPHTLTDGGKALR